MKINLKYFLVAAEEMNFARAARRLYVSPQCLSNHIKRLESSFKATLFQRKPKLALTQEGEAVVKSLSQIQIIENSLESELNEIKSGSSGTLRVGIHSTRSRFLLPLVIGEYRKLYPNVKLSLHSDVTSGLEALVLRGKLDLFIGRNTATMPGLNTILLQEESMYLIVSDDLLAKYFPKPYPKKKASQKGVYLTDFKNVPFLQNEDTSNITIALKEFADQNNLTLNVVLQVSDSGTHFYLCEKGYGAFMCPETIVASRQKLYGTLNFNVFPIIDFSPVNRIVLGYHKDTFLPRYAKDFIKITKHIYQGLKYFTGESSQVSRLI